jgi:head-tail adaptor
MASIWEVPGRLWAFARQIEEMAAVQSETEAELKEIDARLRGLEDRMTRLEASQGGLIVEAKAAAGAAATGLASAILSDVVTRVTRIELRQDELNRRLSAPN